MSLQIAELKRASAEPRWLSRCLFSPMLVLLAILASMCPEGECIVLLRGRAWNSSAGVEKASNASKSSGGVGGSQLERAPRLYLLFLAVGQINNFEVWESFFSNAPPEHYRAFIHCKEQSCKDKVAGSPLVVVPTVPTKYCKDLVTAQQQLIHYALRDTNGGVNPSDKFAFVSDSTLPAKPFSTVYSTLIGREGSDFCISPTFQWKVGFEPWTRVIKHGQWIVLARAHAEQADRKWSKVDAAQYKKIDNCLDEFWYAFILFGPVFAPRRGHLRQQALDHFTGGPLVTSPSAGLQGQCDTFTLRPMDRDSSFGHDTFDLYHELDEASTPRAIGNARPGSWATVSRQGMRKMRDSSFLFLRKFVESPKLLNANMTPAAGDFAKFYIEIVLA